MNTNLSESKSGRYLPCKYLIITHIVAPKMKFLSIIGTKVKGIQKTANRRSLIDKLSRNTFVTVRIRLFCMMVMMTKKLPTTARRKIKQYKGICISQLNSADCRLPSVLLSDPFPPMMSEISVDGR